MLDQAGGSESVASGMSSVEPRAGKPSSDMQSIGDSESVASMSSLTTGMRAGGTAGTAAGSAEQQFTLAKAKELAFSKLSTEGKTAFREAYMSPAIDRLLIAAFYYFGTRFRLERVRERLRRAESEATEKSGAASTNSQPSQRPLQHQGDASGEAAVATQQRGAMRVTEAMAEQVEDLQAQIETSLRVMGMVYAGILLRESNRENNSEMHFFESMYEFLISTQCHAFERPHWVVIESELGRLFRTSNFNSNARRHQPRPQQISLRKLYQLQFKDPFKRSHQSALRGASLARSELIDSVVPLREHPDESACRELLCVSPASVALPFQLPETLLAAKAAAATPFLPAGTSSNGQGNVSTNHALQPSHSRTSLALSCTSGGAVSSIPLSPRGAAGQSIGATAAVSSRQASLRGTASTVPGSATTVYDANGRRSRLRADPHSRRSVARLAHLLDKQHQRSSSATLATIDPSSSAGAS